MNEQWNQVLNQKIFVFSHFDNFYMYNILQKTEAVYLKWYFIFLKMMQNKAGIIYKIPIFSLPNLKSYSYVLLLMKKWHPS